MRLIGPCASVVGILLWVALVPAARGAPLLRMTLAETYQRALENNEQHRISGERVREASVLRFDPLTDVLPRVSIVASDAVQTNSYPQPRAALIVQQPILVGGFRSGRRAAILGVESAQADELRARQEVMFDSVFVFIAVLRARQQVQVAQGALTRADAQFESAQARLKAGAALRTTLLLSAIDRRRAQIGVVDARRSLKLTEAAFTRLVDMPPPETLVLPPPPYAPPLPQAIERAATRSDLRSLEILALRSKALLDSLEGRAHWPSLTLEGRVETFTPLVAPRDSLEVRFLGTLEIPLSRGGIDVLEMRRQRVTATIAELEARGLKEEILEEVRVATARLEGGQQTATLSREQIKDARENYSLVEAQFKLGAATPLEVANAQAALTEAENLDLVANYDQQLAVYELLFATGQLQL